MGQLAGVLQFSVRGVMAMHGADPKARASMDFMLQFAADTLRRQGDVPGAALMACCAGVLAGVAVPHAASLPADVAAAYAVAVRRAAARGWHLVPPDQGDRRPQPAADPDVALKDALAFSMMCFSSRLDYMQASRR